MADTVIHVAKRSWRVPRLMPLDEEAMLHVKTFVYAVAGDQPFHARLLADGYYAFYPQFRIALAAALAHRPENVANRLDQDQMSKRSFAALERMWKNMHAPVTVAQFLDFQVAEQGISEAEIDRSWEIEIGSSEEAMRRYWEGSSRTRRGRLDELGTKPGTRLDDMLKRGSRGGTSKAALNELARRTH